MMFFKTCAVFLVLVAACDGARHLSQDIPVITEAAHGRSLLSVATVSLGTAGEYVIIAKSGISNVPSSAITGNIAVSPIGDTAMTGFYSALEATGDFATSTQVTGNMYAPTFITNDTPAKLTTAVIDMEAAYDDAAGRPAATTATNLNLDAGLLNGNTLTAGIYTFRAGDVAVSVSITDGITFSGSATDIFIIQVSGSVFLGNGARVTLEDGAIWENIFWQVAGHVVMGTTSHMEGVILSETAVVFNTGSSLNGRALAKTAVTLQGATVKAAPSLPLA